MGNITEKLRTVGDGVGAHLDAKPKWGRPGAEAG